jgi:hypothetical protein
MVRHTSPEEEGVQPEPVQCVAPASGLHQGGAEPSAACGTCGGSGFIQSQPRPMDGPDDEWCPECMSEPPPPPWKCAGCGRETTDRVRNCQCPTSCLFRRANGRSESALKFEHAAHARWPHLRPLEALLVDALQGVMGAAELGDYLRERCSYSHGDRYTQPEEFGIEWHWQQSTPEDGWATRLRADIEAHLADAAETEEDLGDALLDWQRNPILAARAALETALGNAEPAAGQSITPGMPS